MSTWLNLLLSTPQVWALVVSVFCVGMVIGHIIEGRKQL